MTTEEVAERLGVTKDALIAWRRRGQGPRYVKAGRSVRYDAADIDEWIEAQKVTPTRSAS